MNYGYYTKENKNYGYREVIFLYLLTKIQVKNKNT